MAPDKRLRHNATFDIIGESIWGFQSGMVPAATFLTVLLTRYGAGNTTIGVVSAIQGSLALLPQLAGLYIFASPRSRQPRLLLWHVFGIIPFQFLSGLLVLADRWLDPAWMRIGLLLLTALLFTGFGTVIGAWSEWLAHLFHERIRATVMGIALCLFSALGAAGGLISGWLLDRYPGTGTYAGLFIASAVIAWLSIVVFWQIDDPARDEPDTSARPTLRGLARRFSASLADWNFRSFLIGRVLVSIGLCVAPFMAVYYQSPDGGRIPDGLIVACGSAMTIGTGITTLIIGRIGDRRGHLSGVIAGAVIQVLTLAVLVFSAGKVSCVLAYLGVGICTGFAFISHTNMLYETCPHDDRLAHITVGNVVMTAPLLVAPLLAGGFATRWGLRPLFLVSLLVTAAAAAWFIAFVREPRRMRVSGPRAG